MKPNDCKTFEPQGIKYFCQIEKVQFILVTHGEWAGWLVKKHPDGFWYSYRRATLDDIGKINAAFDAVKNN